MACEDCRGLAYCLAAKDFLSEQQAVANELAQPEPEVAAAIRNQFINAFLLDGPDIQPPTHAEMAMLQGSDEYRAKLLKQLVLDEAGVKAIPARQQQVFALLEAVEGIRAQGTCTDHCRSGEIGRAALEAASGRPDILRGEDEDP